MVESVGLLNRCTGQTVPQVRILSSPLALRFNDLRKASASVCISDALKWSAAVPSAFRFLVICQGASMRADDRLVTLTGVVNELSAAPGEQLELAAVIGLILAPQMKGKSLDLMAWRLDRSGTRQPIPGYAGTPLILPDGLGPSVAPYAIRLPATSTSIHGFDLFDRDGVFGSPEQLLATYMLGLSLKTGN